MKRQDVIKFVILKNGKIFEKSDYWEYIHRFRLYHPLSNSGKMKKQLIKVEQI